MRHLRKAFLALALLAAQSVNALEDRGTKEDQDACTPDVFNLCSAVIPDEPAILACLQEKKSALSPACAKVLFPDDAASPRKRKASKRSESPAVPAPC